MIVLLALALTGAACSAAADANSQPVPIKIVEPAYSDEAKRAKYKADVFLTVTVDNEGHPQNVRICRPVGLGLDEQALKAVRLWKFRPVVRNGTPTYTQIVIEVSFRPDGKTKSKVANKADLPTGVEYGDR